MNNTLPSQFLSKVIDYCPETHEEQGLLQVGNDSAGNLILVTRGKSTAWKHIIISEEVDPDNLPCGKPIKDCRLRIPKSSAKISQETPL